MCNISHPGKWSENAQNALNFQQEIRGKNCLAFVKPPGLIDNRLTIGCKIGCKISCTIGFKIRCKIGCKIGCKISCTISCTINCPICCKICCKIGCKKYIDKFSKKIYWQISKKNTLTNKADSSLADI